VVYNFPKTKLVDGPLQIEARIDQNAQLSGTIDAVESAGLARAARRPACDSDRARAAICGAYLTCKPSESPMPELRLVVLALQDRLAYGPTFESAMASLFGGRSRP